MKRKEKVKRTESSSEDEDSDAERNFTLLAQRGGAEGDDDGEVRGEEEEEEEDEEEDEEDAHEEEEGKGVEPEDRDSEESNDDEDDEDDDDDEEGSDDDDEDNNDDEDPQVAGGSTELQTREDVKKELSNMSFEDIMELQNKVGTKVYNEVAYGKEKKQETTNKKRRLNKNRPVEVSAKKPVPYLRQVVAVKKTTHRDPRFDDLSGAYKPEIFNKTYNFINDIKQREKKEVQKQLKKTKTNGEKKEKLQFLLKRMENQERARIAAEQRRETELQLKRQQRELANQGTRPFFLKKSEKKKLQLAEKYQDLKKSGKLEKFLSKKRKRNAGKDRRKLPQSHKDS